MRRTITTIVVCLCLAAVGPACAEPLPTAIVRVGGYQVAAEVPVSWAQRARGFSGRESLAPGQGMAFVYLQPHTLMMHMKGMKFGLDFIFCRNGRITQIERGVRPSERAVEVSSDQPVHFVLEIAEGRALELGLRMGDDCIIEISPELRRRLEQFQQ